MGCFPGLEDKHSDVKTLEASMLMNSMEFWLFAGFFSHLDEGFCLIHLPQAKVIINVIFFYDASRKNI